MKKLIILACVLSISAIGSAQIEVNSSGKTGIGTTPTDARLTLGGDHITLIRMLNGNNHSWIIGNYHTSPWSAPNTLAIYDETSARLVMEFRQDATYIHNKLRVGNGNGIIHRDYKGSGGQTTSYDFNPNKSNTSYMGTIFEHTHSESSGFYGDSDFAVIWSAGDYGYLLKVLDEDGMNLKWYLDGSGNAFTNSDKNKKKDIKKINGSLNKVKNLKGVTYKFILTPDEELKNDSIINGLIDYSGDIENFKEKIKKDKSGFLAQDIEKIIPEVVETNEKGEKFVNYSGVIPYLVEAIKEQQIIIDELDYEISKLKTKDSGCQKSGTTELTTANSIEQNNPNPFSQSTSINYTVMSEASHAMICIYDLNGTQLKCYEINQTGNGTQIISAHELTAGMYLYSLIVNGQLVDTKRMILTE